MPIAPFVFHNMTHDNAPEWAHTLSTNLPDPDDHRQPKHQPDWLTRLLRWLFHR